MRYLLAELYMGGPHRLGLLLVGGLLLSAVFVPPTHAFHSMCGGLQATIVGGPGHEWLYGTSGPDVISGGGGDDRIFGGGGNDVICGGDGADYLLGEGGNDRLYGEGGRDTLRGDTGNDLLDGGADNDRLFGEEGEDYLAGNAGYDQCERGRPPVSGDTVVTCELVADTPVSGLRLGGRSTRSIHILWNDTIIGETGYRITWRAAGTSISAWRYRTVAPNATSAVVSGLNHSTAYEFYVSPCLPDGTCPRSLATPVLTVSTVAVNECRQAYCP